MGEVRDSESLEQVRAVALAGKADVPGNRQVGEQAVVLRQVADAPPLGAQANPSLRIEPQLAAERDAAGPWALEAGHGSQQ